MRHARHNAVNWFEIPADDLDRAQAFYEAVFATPLRRQRLGAHAMAVFPYEKYGVGGCLLAGSGMPRPGGDGAVVYLNAEPSLDAALARVRAAGGRVTVPRTDLPDGMGCFAHIADSEGNRIGLHAQG